MYYVECGTQFAVDVGDIAKWYYASLMSMFDKVLQTFQHSDQDTIDRFLPRLEAIQLVASFMCRRNAEY